MRNVLGILMILIPTLLLLCGMMRKNEGFFNLRKVFINHFLLFKRARLQYLNFYVFPLFIAIGIVNFFVPTEDYYSQQNVIISIFISSLLAILSIIDSKKYEEERIEKIKIVLDETSNAIVFSVCLCVFLMIISLVMSIAQEMCMGVLRVIGAISIYFMIVILMNMLLIIKRLEELIRA